MQLGLRPMRCLEVEYNDVGEMLAVFVLTAKDKQLTALPETRCVTYIVLATTASS